MPAYLSESCGRATNEREPLQSAAIQQHQSPTERETIMSRSTVRSTVAAAIDEAIASANAGSYVTPLLLQVKEAAIDAVSANVDTLIDTAQETLTNGAIRLGATRAQVEGLFEQAGVNHDPEPEVADEPAAEETFTVTKSMWDRVESALSWARGRGFTG